MRGMAAAWMGDGCGTPQAADIPAQPVFQCKPFPLPDDRDFAGGYRRAGMSGMAGQQGAGGHGRQGRMRNRYFRRFHRPLSMAGGEERIDYVLLQLHANLLRRWSVDCQVRIS